MAVPELHLRDIFLKCEQYCPSPKQFNDPFDSNMPLSAEGTDQEKREFFARLYANPENYEEVVLAEKIQSNPGIVDENIIEAELMGTLEEIRENVSILSFSEFNNNILRWSHYADGHKGFCLEFDTVIDSILISNLRKVAYLAAFPSASIYNVARDQILLSMMLTKSSQWLYEGEWRTVLRTDKQTQSGVVTFTPDALTGIIFGCEMSKEDKLKVQWWIDRGPTNPKLFWAEKKGREFGLDIVDYEP